MRYPSPVVQDLVQAFADGRLTDPMNNPLYHNTKRMQAIKVQYNGEVFVLLQPVKAKHIKEAMVIIVEEETKGEIRYGSKEYNGFCSRLTAAEWISGICRFI